MADCSYSRCIQQRRNIRRDLQRWTKNMVYIVGLERIAEELMGRRKWKLYQDSMHRNHLQPLNNNIKKSEKYQKDSDSPSPRAQEVRSDENITTTTTTDNNNRERSDEDAAAATAALPPGVAPADEDTGEEASCGRTSAGPTDADPVADEDKSKDWSPQSKCYFCVDGKLDEHNNHGALSPRHTDSDSSDSPNNSDLEPPPTLTPSASLLNNLSGRNMTALDSVTSMAALATVAALSGNAPGPTGGPHLPYYPTGLLQPQWFQLANLAATARNFQPERAAETAAEKSTSGEQPLDLSSKGGNSNGSGAADGKINAGMRLPSLDKHIFNSDFRAKPRMSAVAGRRTYTEDELQAALRDIQSGKLGTRRAAVIYGIPRSTLRNKVYKLALERERETHLNTKFDEDEAMDDDKDLSGAEEEKEVEKALERPLLSMADILRFSNLENAEVIKGLLQKGREEIEGGPKGIRDGGLEVDASALGPIRHFIMNGLLKSNEDGITDYVKRLVAEDFLGDQKNGDSEKPSRPSPATSAALTTTTPTPKPFCKSESDMETEDSTSNVILKIPSYKPTSSGSSSKNGDTYNNTRDNLTPNMSLVSPPINSESPPVLPGKGMTLKDVKDVIAKSISQKFQERPEPMQMDFKRVGFTPPLSGMCVVKNQPELRYQPNPQIQNQAQQKPQQNSQNSNSSGSGGGGGKGTRPKRGKYRNYDRDSLVEAVRAVQRGEMSVHRAGSYYGVPHSTLEYKVKERHLMRPRKRDPKPNPVDEKIASLKQNDLRNEKLKTQAQQVLKPQQQQKFSPNGMKLTPQIYENIPLGFSTPPFPFWAHPSFHHIPMDYRSSTSAGFPANPEQFAKAGFPANPEQFPAAGAFPANPEQFFASQMMQKLHEESARVSVNLNVKNAPALAKNARQMAESLLDNAGSNGFLDGIIRSSLESGVPNNDDKKEDKNVSPEHMSNKALLDQLCRNSRLTPLTKPNNLTESSSGDDEESVKKGSPDNSNSTGPETETPDNIQTIELSNDSNDSSKHPDEKQPTSRIYLEQSEERDPSLSPASRIYLKKDEKDGSSVPPLPLPPGRIYLKQELTKPENLKPEMLVRYRDVVLHDVDNRNGIITEGSASESDAAQD